MSSTLFPPIGSAESTAAMLGMASVRRAAVAATASDTVSGVANVLHLLRSGVADGHKTREHHRVVRLARRAAMSIAGVALRV
jgi:hypothetical protein